VGTWRLDKYPLALMIEGLLAECWLDWQYSAPLGFAKWWLGRPPPCNDLPTYLPNNSHTCRLNTPV
jgi:hypothetical protein